MFLELISGFLLGFGQLSGPGQENKLTPGPDSLTVYVFLLDDCVISQYYTPQLNQLHHKYKEKGVGMIGYFPNFISKPEKIAAFGETFHIDFPLKPDYFKDWTRKFGITVTPEVAVWDHRSDRLIYKGRIDDSYVRVGRRNRHPQSKDLEEIIEQWLLNQTPASLVETQAIGCFINFTDPVSSLKKEHD